MASQDESNSDSPKSLEEAPKTLSQAQGNIAIRGVEDEMKRSYLDYAMSVIVGRALPDARDGLKPVHRRVLYAMHELSNGYNRPYKKSARVVGDVIGKYHPHGDSAVYGTIVRMAQDFSMREILIDGQGNFGSVDGDSAAAMRYTEVRMTRLTSELLADIDKETVNHGSNYDDSLQEPLVMPCKFPNLLVNGSSGIAVGMATNIPPHNLREAIDACIMLIENPQATAVDLMQVMPGPDFPTGAYLCGRGQILNYFQTGRGVLTVRAKSHFETHPKTDRTSIVVDEIPFQVNKARLIEVMADLVRDKKLEGISDIRDESDRDGMRIVVDLKRDAIGDVVLNQLFKHTAMQSSFGVTLLAIVNGQPKVMPVKELIQTFLQHRREVVTRRTRYDLRKARERFNVLMGLLCALDNIDRIITLIRAAKDADEARGSLLNERFANPGSLIEFASMEEEAIQNAQSLGYFQLNGAQVQAILEMRLQRLTGLERDKILDEATQMREAINEFRAILGSHVRLMEVITEELKAIRTQYGSPRRTQIIDAVGDLSIEDLIADEDVMVTVTHQGYIKRTAMDLYRSQKRGGRGRSAITTKEEDFVADVFVASTHSYIFVFTNRGRMYALKVHEIPDASLASRGKPIINLLPMLVEGETVQTILPVRRFEEGKFIFMATRNGVVKKSELMLFANVRSSGIIACILEEGDALVNAKLTSGHDEIMLVTKLGMAVRFGEGNVRAMGRASIGVIGIRLEKDDLVVALEAVSDDNAVLLTICKNGYGKRTLVGEYRGTQRGAKGVIAIQTSERNGGVVSALVVGESDDLMISTNQGTMIRTRISEIRILGRNTQGVKLIALDDEESVVSVARIESDGQEESPALADAADTVETTDAATAAVTEEATQETTQEETAAPEAPHPSKE